MFLVKYRDFILKLFCAVLISMGAFASENGTYDYIVVGAGAGGGPLASSLAEKGFSVLLLEAGDLKEEDLDYTEIPALHVKASERPGLSWKYFIEHYSDASRAVLDSKRCPGASGCEPGDTGVFYPRGSTVGGSSAVNAMISVIPHDSDWNHIADVTGDSSWSAPAMREYLMKVERNIQTQDSQDTTNGHGTSGWLPTNHNAVLTIDPGNSAIITLPEDVTSSYSALLYGSSVAAAIGSNDYQGVSFLITDANRLRETSIPPVSDPNDPNDPGFRIAPRPGEPIGFYQVPVAVDKHGKRGGVTGRILDTVDQNHPLTLQTNSLVHRVLFDDSGDKPKAIGVEYLPGEHLYRADRNVNENANPQPVQVYANNEVILSAGAFNTPQLLMLSGIGPQAELQAHQIATRVDLPGVGQNLQDRYEAPVVFKKRIRFSTTPLNFPALAMCNFDPEIPDECYEDWSTYGLGVYTQPGAIASMIKKSTELSMTLEEINDSNPEADPDLYIFGVGGTFKGYYPGYSEDTFDPDNQFTWVVLKGHSNNQGNVRLRSSDPRDTPIINFKYFGDPASGQQPSAEHMNDLDAMVKGIRLSRKAALEASNYLFYTDFGVYEEIWPGAHINTDQEIRQFVMNESWGHHASCTAKIGAPNDPMAVLDSRFRVYGTEGLRVVDASVFPKIPGFFPAVAIYMLSEKAADVIAEDATTL